MGYRFLSGAAAAAMLISAPAGATIYECHFEEKASNGNWLPNVSVVEYDEKAGKATVFDPLIKYFVTNPLNAKIETDNDIRTSFNWILPTKDNAGHSSKIAYRLTIRKADLSANVHGKVMVYDNEPWDAQGRCKIVK